MTVAGVLRAAYGLMTMGFAPGACSYDAAGNPVLEWNHPGPANWCLDDALMRAASGDKELAHAAYVLVSDVAGGGSPVLTMDELQGGFPARPKAEVLKLVALAVQRAAATERRSA